MPMPGIELSDKTRLALINLRLQKNLSQQALADLVGTSRLSIARMESAEPSTISRELLEKIAAALSRRIEVKTVTTVRMRKIDSPRRGK